MIVVGDQKRDLGLTGVDPHLGGMGDDAGRRPRLGDQALAIDVVDID